MTTTTRSTLRLGGQLLALALPLALCLALAPAPASDDDSPCERTASDAHTACRRLAQGDYFIQRAKCINLPTQQQRSACFQAALADLNDAFDVCEEQEEAREDLCDDLGGGIYHPLIDPAQFVAVVDNPYFPLLPGTTFVYEKDLGGEVEHIEVSVLDETTPILGVECTVVHDVVTIDGVRVEDTLDWFAQDVHGNVWYFGEIALNFENGLLHDVEGSWTAGVDGAKPGFIMLAAPHTGDLYRQEFLIGEAEDVAEVLSLSKQVSVPYGTFAHCLKTEDFTPIEPDALEHKFYAPGVGHVLTVDVASGARTELIAILTE